MQRTANIKRPKALDELIEPSLMSRLSQLDISSRKIFSGKLKGERRSKKRGESVEFADHRSYVTGDDIRHIDWNLFARLDQLFLKLFLEEEDLSLHVVLDCSASHDCGEPNKFLFMQKLAMALSYIGLVNLNRVGLSAIGGLTGDGKEATPAAAANAGLTTIRDLRGRRRVQDIAQFLCSLEPTGSVSFTEACKRIALTRRGKGVMIVLSDFFIKEGYETGLRLLVGHGYDLFAIQVLSPEEVEPKITGDLRLKDVEDAELAEVTISAPLLKRYKANLTAYCDQLHKFCARRDIVHMIVKSDTPVDTFVLDYLRKRGLLK